VPTPSRRPVTAVLVGAASAALVLTSAVGAQAATPTSTVTMDQAFAALPTAKLLPGSVRLAAKVETPGSATVDPCPELDLINFFAQSGSAAPTIGLPLKGSMVAAAYEPAHSQTPKDKTASWTIEVVVFHTAKLATAAAKQLAKVEKACPRKVPPIRGLPISIPLVRVHSTSYAVDGWKGYRTVDMISTFDLLQGPDPVGSRQTQVFLTRGNVMLNVTESGDIEPGTAARQEKWRQTATRLMLTQLDPLLG